MNPGTLLPLWDIVDDYIVTTRGAVFFGAELCGSDPTHVGDDDWNVQTSALASALRRLPEGVAVQFVMEHRGVRADELAEQMGVDALATPAPGDVATKQRLWRYRHLQQGGLRRRRTFVFGGWRTGLSRREFRKPSRAAFRRQVDRTRGLAEDLRAMLGCCGVEMRGLSRSEIESLYYDWLHPEGGAGPIGQTIGGLSLRECLIADNVSWDPHHARVGATGFKVLAAKSLPDQVHGALWEEVAWRQQRDDGSFCEGHMDFDFRVIVNMMVPSAKLANWFLHLRRNNARSDQGIQEEDAVLAESELSEMKTEISDGGSIINVGVQVVVPGPDRKTLRARAAKMMRACNVIGIPLYEESMAHHVELFKSLPGMVSHWDRWMQVTNIEAADLTPKSTHSLGDPDPSLVMELATTAEPFGLTLRSESRPNYNFLILGGSGAGKSVFLNMLLAYEVLFGPKAGRLLAIDYASPDKSSLLVAADVFGGDYIPIRADGKRINPFPAPEVACPRDGQSVDPIVLATLVELGNILFRNTGDGREAGLYSALIQRVVRTLYERWETAEAPTYSDFYEMLCQLSAEDEDDAMRLRDLKKLVVSSVIEGPESTLFNGQTTARTDGDFLVYDLHGLEGLDDRTKAGVVLVTTNLVRGLAFDGRPERYKTIVFEEATALMKLGMVGLMEELLTTARAHNTSVGVITQLYDRFRASDVASTVTAMTPVWAFLSHGSAQNAIAPIVRDFGFSKRQEEVLSSLRCVKRKYSEVMTVMQTETPRGVEETTSKARLRLSPYDYWLVTSDAKDRATQRRLRSVAPDLSHSDAVEVLARRAAS